MRRSMWGLLIAGFVLAGGVEAARQSGRVVSPFNTTGGVALDGYDVVAYFEEGKPVKGSSRFAHRWQDTTWHFASEARRDTFARNPDRFAPQFGGFCAYGVSRGYAVDIDPEAWAIVDGRLYLNYSKSVQRTWNQDRAGYIAKAEANWPAVSKQRSGR